MADENTQSKRTTVEQLEYFVEFVRKNPELLSNKNDPREPQRVQRLWTQLAEGLNSMSGPTRGATKWKETLTHWKHQLRSRARKIKVSNLATGGGPPGETKLKKFGERALEAFGTLAVDGLSDLPTLGLGNCGNNVSAHTSQEMVIDCEDQDETKSEYLDSEYLGELFLSDLSQPAPGLNAFPINSPGRSEIVQNPAPTVNPSAVSHKPGPSLKKKMESHISSQGLMEEVLKMMKERDKRDSVLQQENLAVQKSLAEAIKALGNSVKCLAESISNHNKNDSSSDTDEN